MRAAHRNVALRNVCELYCRGPVLLRYRPWIYEQEKLKVGMKKRLLVPIPKSRLLFVSLIKLIRSKLSNFAAHVSGGTVTLSCRTARSVRYRSFSSGQSLH